MSQLNPLAVIGAASWLKGKVSLWERGYSAHYNFEAIKDEQNNFFREICHAQNVANLLWFRTELSDKEIVTLFNRH
jgi:hypothetical protein